MVATGCSALFDKKADANKPDAAVAMPEDAAGPEADADNIVYELVLNIMAESDDAEETQDGVVAVGSDDLDFSGFGAGTFYVGLRFLNVTIPPGSKITAAHLQLTANQDTQTQGTMVGIRAERNVDPTTFLAVDGDLSGRSSTGANVNWIMDPWLLSGDRLAAQRSPTFPTVVQELINQEGWQSGNPMVIMISGNPGRRSANAFSLGGSATLTISYTLD